MFLKIIIGLVVIIGGLVVFAAMKPSHSEIAREIVIDAPAAKVFPYVNTRSLANSWNPFLRKDTQAKIAFSGPEVGVGAVTSWNGGKELGTGSATVVESVPNEKVAVKLEYEKPMRMSQLATYLITPMGGQTKVVWRVEGEAPLFARVMCLFMDMDKMVGDVFEQGLGELKTMVEASK